MPTPTVSRVMAVGTGLLLLVAVATPAAASKSKSVSSSSLKKLTNNIANSKHLVDSATYKSVSEGQTQVVSIAQDPPKSNFTSSTGEVVDTGTRTYYCSISAGKEECLATGSGANPFTGLEELFSPSLALTAFAEAKEGLISRALGIKVSESSATIAGQASTCVTVSAEGKGGKYCVTKQGLLSYSGAAGTYFELTKFSTSPSGSLFQLPAGATTVTLPGGASIP